MSILLTRMEWMLHSSSAPFPGDQKKVGLGCLLQYFFTVMKLGLLVAITQTKIHIVQNVVFKT